MEKFGIFQLLDTLSALSAAQPAETKPSPTERPAQQPAESAAAKQPAAEAPRDAEHTAHTSADALASFLARHEEVRRRAEKK